MSFHVYVIQNDDGVIYEGITANLEKRLTQHRRGRTISTNKGNLNWQLIHVWHVPTYMLASLLERYLHRLTKDEVLDLTIDCPSFSIWLHRQILALPITDYELEKSAHLGATVNERLIVGKWLRRFT